MVAFLLASAVPIGALGFFALQSPERREALLDKVPDGAGGRALAAGIAFGVLALLAWVALPAFHGASAALQDGLERLRQAPLLLRILALPLQALVWLLWFSLQLLFAVDAFLILVAAIVGLLLAVRIVKPGFLPDVLPQLTR